MNQSKGDELKPDPADSGKTAAERIRGSSAEDDPQEEPLWEGGFSGKAMVGSWVGAAILSVAGVLLAWKFANHGTGWAVFGVGLVVVWGGLGLVLAYRKLSIRYQLTTQRFIHMQGILKRVADRIEVIDIDDVTYEQGIVERMLGVGNVKVISSDRSHPELWMRGIEDVKNVADMIDDIRRKERMRRGLHIEAI